MSACQGDFVILFITRAQENAFCNGRPMMSSDAHRGDGKRFIVRADEKLTAFVELESAVGACGELSRQAGEIFGKTHRN